MEPIKRLQIPLPRMDLENLLYPSALILLTFTSLS